jgi:hypothetical protein
VTADLCNFQGNRDLADGKGRLERCIESLPMALIGDRRLEWRLVDCGSTDGSDCLLHRLPGDVIREHRDGGAEPWEATTRTNARLLARSVEFAAGFLWRIENDSVFLGDPFVQSGEFLWNAIRLMEENPRIGVVHLRRFTPVDRADMPGSGANASRTCRTLPSVPQAGHMIQKAHTRLIWVDVTPDLPAGFVPDDQWGYGRCPAWNPEEPRRGAVRQESGRWYRLVENKFATYTNHGWIARTSMLKQVFESRPASEEQISDAVYPATCAARLGRDAFVAAGWRTRLRWSRDLVQFAVNWANTRPGTVWDGGGSEPIESFPEIRAAYGVVRQNPVWPGQAGAFSIE